MLSMGQACCCSGMNGSCVAMNEADMSPKSAEVKGTSFLGAEEYGMTGLDVGACRDVFNINLHDESTGSRQNIERYFRLCKDHPNLHVTTSCFTSWRKNKKTNGFAKVIPVVSPGSSVEAKRPIRIFFFDDNLEWGGSASSTGICNLRDVCTGDFVNFAEGQNGFLRDRAARYTAIHHSPEYRVVLVKANILDAMEDVEYFSDIIKKYSEPDEQLIVFMDVNATIVCNDTIQGKDFRSTLLGTMFEFLELRPPAAFELQWGSSEPLRVEKPKTFKSLIKEMTGKDHLAYTAFWAEANCLQFFAHLATKGQVMWVADGDAEMTLESFQTLFQEYVIKFQDANLKDGITRSWFQAFTVLQEQRHTTVLNSFGVDTRKVVRATADDESDVLQVAVNYELWDDRDVSKFGEQFTKG